MAQLPIFDAARTFDLTTLTGVYQNVGIVVDSVTFGFVMYNTSDVDIQISFDLGATDGPIIPSRGTFDASAFSQVTNQEQASKILPGQTQIQVKQVTGVGTSGNLIVNVARK